MRKSEIVGDGYEIIRLLGGGGMGTVYEARHNATGQRVALKILHEDARGRDRDSVARFQREARAVGAIEALHVVQVLDAGTDAATGRPYMVMELLDGEDLESVLARLGPLRPELALRVVAQACIGLERAHQVGVVHRDIKPANLFLSKLLGGEIVVKILDFGVAKIDRDVLASMEKATLTRTGSIVGSPLYMSPEQIEGERGIDPRSDVWSLGVVLYEALTGATPHGHCETFGKLLLAVCSTAPRSVQERAPWVPSEAAAIAERALQVDPSRRFQSVAEMLRSIHRLLPDGTQLDDTMLCPR